MSGIMVDMDAVTQSLWTKNNEAQLVKTLVQQVGMMTSALEHQIPEMLFTNEENPGEGVSAVKAMGLASAQGQRIYQVTSQNVNAVLPVLNISSDVKDEIRASVAVGKVATVSQNQITVGNWTGVGYIIADPETGAGAYRISGGSNGAILEAGGMFGIMAASIIIANDKKMLPANFLAFLFANLVVHIALFVYLIKASGGDEIDVGCFILGFILGFDTFIAGYIAMSNTVGNKEGLGPLEVFLTLAINLWFGDSKPRI